jgi:nucleoporin GLE1
MTDISKYSEPTIDITPFLAIPQDGVARPMPAPFVYLLNLVAKITLKQFCNESATSVDAVAIAAVTVFSKVEFKYQGTMSLFDILLAKFHAVCPILFGINGDERTASGRRRIGWWEPDGDFVDDEQHKNRMTGLAMGYGYLSLRDFSKSKMLNPFPPTNYWRALSYIANTPQSELQPTHFVVVRALVEGHVEKFLKFYGQAGVAALRKVLVELPKGAPPSAARDTAAVMPSSLQKTLHLTL